MENKFNLNSIIEKALRDPNFKKKLIQDPKKAIQEAFKVTLPADFKLEILEESEKKKYLVIPHVPAGTEVSEKYLESISAGAEGGTRASTYCCKTGAGYHLEICKK